LLASDDVVKREFGAFESVNDNFPKYVLSLDKLDFSRDGIKHINIIDFLLGINS
jgi:predicted AAA+ superfamily ATPase